MINQKLIEAFEFMMAGGAERLYIQFKDNQRTSECRLQLYDIIEENLKNYNIKWAVHSKENYRNGYASQRGITWDKYVYFYRTTMNTFCYSTTGGNSLDVNQKNLLYFDDLVRDKFFIEL